MDIIMSFQGKLKSRQTEPPFATVMPDD